MPEPGMPTPEPGMPYGVRSSDDHFNPPDEAEGPDCPSCDGPMREDNDGDFVCEDEECGRSYDRIDYASDRYEEMLDERDGYTAPECP